MQCGILNISQPYRPSLPVTVIALLLFQCNFGNSVFCLSLLGKTVKTYLKQCPETNHRHDYVLARTGSYISVFKVVGQVQFQNDPCVETTRRYVKYDYFGLPPILTIL
jgi:hypothetical protein